MEAEAPRALVRRTGEMRAGTLAISTDASTVSTDTRTNPASTCQIDWGPRTTERPQRQQLGRPEANGVPLAWRTRSGVLLSHPPPRESASLPMGPAPEELPGHAWSHWMAFSSGPHLLVQLPPDQRLTHQLRKSSPVTERPANNFWEPMTASGQ